MITTTPQTFKNGSVTSRIKEINAKLFSKYKHKLFKEVKSIERSVGDGLKRQAMKVTLLQKSKEILIPKKLEIVIQRFNQGRGREMEVPGCR